RALDITDATYPFVRELFARQLVSGAGPLPAAGTLHAARACTGEEAAADVQALALALAMVGTMHPALDEVVAPARSTVARLHHASILLFSDFVLSRAWTVVAELPVE